ncbi:MAG: hypothetical protein ACRD47_06100, partial [Nitrososphaeraceae archaeon]
MHPKREKDLHFVRIDVGADQFKIFKRIYKNFDTVFLLESLQGPKELSEISVIGFDPVHTIIIENNSVIVNKGDKSSHYDQPDDLLSPIKSILPRVRDQRFRYVGGAVGYVSYDAVNSWENLKTKTKKKRFLSDTFP